MFDSTNVAAIPRSATLILVYVDGGYVTDSEARRQFPNATLITCTVTGPGYPGARIYDCERGDGNAVTAAQWAQREIANHRRPTIYCSRIGSPGYGWPDVLAELAKLSIPSSAVDFGIADYSATGTPHLAPGSAFTQYANPPMSGGDFDKSITNGVWPYATPPIGEESNMVYWTAGGQNHLAYFDESTHTGHHWWQAIGGEGGWKHEALPMT